MKANQVMEILQISRSTLKRYREKGFIKAVQKPTGQFEFDDDSVWLFKNKHTPRQTILYGRVSTYKQKHDLANQMQELRDFAENKGYHVDNSFSDIDRKSTRLNSSHVSISYIYILSLHDALPISVQKPTGQFEFDDDSVWLFKNKHTPRQTILYGRVSTYKQKHDLANQMQELRDFAENKGYHVDNSFSD